MYEKGEKTVSEICAATNVSKATFYRKLKKKSPNRKNRSLRNFML
ncbi:helix-turn-helix domain-containing protein [Bacillus methanolicus]|uniref:Resolvase HTH domain-containing protein n=1 Tax=Bacillus methanolicus (strain MGA3 / ATCC 53907) TaxID=796606 RepID=A0A068LVR3_BACMM|nr:hypothetical protein BMMGA3_17285 [Bacillus methanolicus MGA3]UQD53885.1 ArsR family transcriptional regulator [Bacillus methanolicus]